MLNNFYPLSLQTIREDEKKKKTNVIKYKRKDNTTVTILWWKMWFGPILSSFFRTSYEDTNWIHVVHISAYVMRQFSICFLFCFHKTWNHQVKKKEKRKYLLSQNQPIARTNKTNFCHEQKHNPTFFYRVLVCDANVWNWHMKKNWLYFIQMDVSIVVENTLPTSFYHSQI